MHEISIPCFAKPFAILSNKLGFSNDAIFTISDMHQISIDKQMYCCYNFCISIRYINKRYGDAYVRVYNFRDAYAKRNERI